MVSQPSQFPQTSPVKSLIAGGVVIAAAIVLFDVRDMGALFSRSQPQVNEKSCHEFVQTEAKLSREQLAALLTIPERDSKERVREVVSEPYCRLANLNLRADVQAEREAYPLEFDPKTQLVILYENDEYAGYRFNFE
ncbi:MAG: hypothetical protein F6K00_17335 [Leptolyngbya sp. SIOISBB]|nr:hypothetical protein [Leptolyngbya sp. SIOISBB]